MYKRRLTLNVNEVRLAKRAASSYRVYLIRHTSHLKDWKKKLRNLSDKMLMISIEHKTKRLN